MGFLTFILRFLYLSLVCGVLGIVLMADKAILDYKTGVDQPSKGSVMHAEEKVDASDDLESVVEWVEYGENKVGDNDRVALGLIGNLWTTRNPNPTAFISTMKGIWTVKYGVEIVNLGRNLYQIKFFH